MKDQRWRPFHDDCERCGCEAEVLTSSGGDYVASVDDRARCPGCGATGAVDIDDGSTPATGHVVWHDVGLQHAAPDMKALLREFLRESAIPDISTYKRLQTTKQLLAKLDNPESGE